MIWILPVAFILLGYTAKVLLGTLIIVAAFLLGWAAAGQKPK